MANFFRELEFKLKSTFDFDIGKKSKRNVGGPQKPEPQSKQCLDLLQWLLDKYEKVVNDIPPDGFSVDVQDFIGNKTAEQYCPTLEIPVKELTIKNEEDVKTVFGMIVAKMADGDSIWLTRNTYDTISITAAALLKHYPFKIITHLIDLSKDRFNETDSDGILHVACICDRPDVVKYLLSKKADIHHKTFLTKPMRQLMKGQGSKTEIQTLESVPMVEMSALECAIRAYSVNVIKTITEGITTTEYTLYTGLNMACDMGNHAGARMLLDLCPQLRKESKLNLILPNVLYEDIETTAVLIEFGAKLSDSKIRNHFWETIYTKYKGSTIRDIRPILKKVCPKDVEKLDKLESLPLANTVICRFLFIPDLLLDETDNKKFKQAVRDTYKCFDDIILTDCDITDQIINYKIVLHCLDLIKEITKEDLADEKRDIIWDGFIRILYIVLKKGEYKGKECFTRFLKLYPDSTSSTRRLLRDMGQMLVKAGFDPTLPQSHQYPPCLIILQQFSSQFEKLFKKQPEQLRRIVTGIDLMYHFIPHFGNRFSFIEYEVINITLMDQQVLEKSCTTYIREIFMTVVACTKRPNLLAKLDKHVNEMLKIILELLKYGQDFSIDPFLLSSQKATKRRAELNEIGDDYPSYIAALFDTRVGHSEGHAERSNITNNIAQEMLRMMDTKNLQKFANDLLGKLDSVKTDSRNRKLVKELISKLKDKAVNPRSLQDIAILAVIEAIEYDLQKADKLGLPSELQNKIFNKELNPRLSARRESSVSLSGRRESTVNVNPRRDSTVSVTNEGARGRRESVAGASTNSNTAGCRESTAGVPSTVGGRCESTSGAPNNVGTRRQSSIEPPNNVGGRRESTVGATSRADGRRGSIVNAQNTVNGRRLSNAGNVNGRRENNVGTPSTANARRASTTGSRKVSTSSSTYSNSSDNRNSRKVSINSAK